MSSNSPSAEDMAESFHDSVGCSSSYGSSNSSSSSSSSSNNVTGAQDSTAALHCWGSGDLYQHGQGHNSDVSFMWSEIKRLGSTTAHGATVVVSCGAHHTVIVTDSGEAYAWGDGRYGQLGCGDENSKRKPTPVSLPPSSATKIRTTACGRHHTLLLSDDGQVYACGHNDCSQLGFDSNVRKWAESQLRPCLLEGLAPRTVSEVACGDRHSLFLFQDGSVAAVGKNNHGQIGDGSRDDAGVPKTVVVSSQSLDRVTSITCGANHNLVITESGRVLCWGLGKACGKRHGDVMMPQVAPLSGRQVVQVSGGRTHSLALTAGGKVYSWGMGKYGQLGLGSVVISSRPRPLRHSWLLEGASSVACGDAYSAVITVSGRLYMWGRNSHLIQEWMEPQYTVNEAQCINPEPLGPLRHVTCGARHAVAVGGLPDFVHTSESDADDDTMTSESEDESDATLSSCTSDEESDFSSSTDTEDSDQHSFSAQTDFPDISSLPSTKATSGPGGVYPERTRLLPVPGKMTKLTIGEFYCLTPDLDTGPPSLSVMEHGSFVSRPPPSYSSITTISHNPSDQPPSLPSITNPSAAARHQNEPPEALPTETQKRGSRHKGEVHASIQNVDLNSLLIPKDAGIRRSRNSAHSTRSKPRSAAMSLSTPAGYELRLSAQGTRDLELSQRGKPDGDVGGDDESAQVEERRSSVELVSRTSFIPPSQPTVQISRSPVKNLPLAGEKCAIVSRNMDILDVHQLLVGGPSRASPQLSSVSQTPQCSLERLRAEEAIDDTGGPKPSPTGFQEEDPQPTVPTHRIDGDFGADKMRTKVRSTSTIFGGLSGQMSKRPTKFFKRPIPIGHLTKTTTQLSQPPYPASSLAQFFHAGPLYDLNAGGDGGEWKRAELASRSSVRSLGAVGVPKIGGTSPEDSPSGSTTIRLFEASLPEASQILTSSRKISLISTPSSGTSWRDRLPLLGDEEKKTQSAPSRRKRVSFADECRSTSVIGHARKPATLAAALSAVSQQPEDTPNFLTGNSRVAPRPEKHRPGKSIITHLKDGQDPKSGFIPALFENHSFFNTRPGRTQRPAPTLAYRTANHGQQVHKASAGGPRSGTLRTLLSTAVPRSVLKSGESRSRSELIVAGSQERQTKRAHFE